MGGSTSWSRVRCDVTLGALSRVERPGGLACSRLAAPSLIGLSKPPPLQLPGSTPISMSALVIRGGQPRFARGLAGLGWGTEPMVTSRSPTTCLAFFQFKAK